MILKIKDIQQNGFDHARQGTKCVPAFSCKVIEWLLCL
jgi:hypothetical protein